MFIFTLWDIGAIIISVIFIGAAIYEVVSIVKYTKSPKAEPKSVSKPPKKPSRDGPLWPLILCIAIFTVIVGLLCEVFNINK